MTSRLNLSDIFLLPNLMSLARVGLAPVIGYCLWRDNLAATLTACVLMLLAGLTDALDGWLARKRGQVTSLGIYLDPIADKVFAVILIGCLILWREMPLWLAAVIVGRDLFIVIGGILLRRQHPIDLPSNITGKYAFAYEVVLLGSYLLRFEFGIMMMTALTLIYIVLSFLGYIRVFAIVIRGGPVPIFKDRTIYKYMRLALVITVSTSYLIRLYLDLIR